MKFWPFKKKPKADGAPSGKEPVLTDAIAPPASAAAPAPKLAKAAKPGKKPKASKASKAGAMVEYLPDADEIERSPVPPMAQLTLQVLIAALVAFVLWASFSQLDKVVIAQGRLINPLPNVVVQPLETSIVQSVDVRTGQVVKKGDHLATLDATFAEADETQLRARLTSLETQIAGLQHELTGESVVTKGDTPDSALQATLLAERRANYLAQQARLRETAGKLRTQINSSRQDQSMLASRLKAMREMEGMQEKMVAQKYGAPIQLLEAQQRSKEVERELQLTRSREQELQRELAAVESDKTAFEKGWRQKALEDMLDVTRERDALKEQLAKADKRSSLVVLTAPIDGVVLEIAKLSPGSIARAAETFFTLVPLAGVMEAEVRIDAGDVGYIKVGDPVHVKLDAFPFQKHGTIDGKVRTISEDAFQRDTTGKTGTAAYYLSRVTLETALGNMVPGARMLPGMTLSAEVVVGKRSVLSYLAWPLTKGITEAVREP